MTATEAQPASSRPWLVARVREVIAETPRVKTLKLDVPGWPGHLPGQRVDIRLTAEDGYQAQRSYSIASPPEEDGVALTVELVPDGEVSDYLVNEVRPEDKFGIRGPFGGHFIWTVAKGGPLFLIAGGSGIVPLMCMLRHRQREASRVQVSLLYSCRTFADIIYREELDAMSGQDPALNITVTLTREKPIGWLGPLRRIDKELLSTHGFGPATPQQIFVCGSNLFAESVSATLVDLGHDPSSIKIERFGPSG